MTRVWADMASKYETSALSAARAVARGGYLGSIPGSASTRWFIDSETGGVVAMFLSELPSEQARISITDHEIVQPGAKISTIIDRTQLEALRRTAAGFGPELVLWLYSYTSGTDWIDTDSFGPYTFVKGKTLPADRSADNANPDKLTEFDQKLDSLAADTAVTAPQNAIRTGKSGVADDCERVFYEHYAGRISTRILPVDDKKLKAAFRDQGLGSGVIRGDLDAIAVTDDGRILPVDLKLRGNHSEVSIGFTKYAPGEYNYESEKDKWRRPADSIVSSFTPNHDYEFGLRVKKRGNADDRMFVGSPEQNEIYRMFKTLSGAPGQLPVAILVYPFGGQTPDFSIDRNKAAAVSPTVAYHLSTVDSFDSIVDSLAFEPAFRVDSVFA